MNKDKLEYYSRLVILVIGIGIIAYLAFTRLLPLVLPFLISWTLAFAVRPLSYKISARVRIPQKWIRLVLSLGILIGGVSLLVGIAIVAGREAWAFLSGLAESEDLYHIISKIMNPLAGIFGESEAGLELEARIGEAISELLSSFLSAIVSFVSNFVKSIPRVVIFSLMCLISLVYFSLDLERINSMVTDHVPNAVSDLLIRLKNRFFSVGLKYIKSYFIIMLVIFVLILSGLLILRVRYALLLALILSVLDILPLVGVGTFIVPWSIFELISGNVGRGIGLIVLLVVAELVRNLIEPRIVGKNLGIHPIVTLVMLYAAFSVFGIFGLLLVPVLTVLFNVAVNKNDSTKIE